MNDFIFINNFRNYRKLNLDIGYDSIFVIYGKNGSGKTNFLEAISLFSDIRGIRKMKLEEAIRCSEGVNFWNVSLTLGNESFSSGYQFQNGNGKRVFSISDKKVKNLDDFKKNYYILWMTYETDRLFIQSPSHRRNFIDMFAESENSGHFDCISSFEKLLKQRLCILKKSMKDGFIISNSTEQWLDVLESRIVDFGLAISKNRMAVTKKLEIGQSEAPFSIKFSNKMSGKIEDIISKYDDELNIKVEYKKILRESRQRDFFSGTTSIGPNRSDWKVFHVGNNIDSFLCSAGEQKILLCNIFFSFVMKKIETDSRNLILLLDDVIAHLDSEHRVVLFDQVRFLKKYFGMHGMRISVWLSGTERSFFSRLEGDAMFFHVENGMVTRES